MVAHHHRGRYGRSKGRNFKLLMNRSFFSPLSLFGAGDQGGAYDFTNMACLFQDRAGTTPVSATGQTIGKITDLSGKNNHLVATTDAQRPIYQGRADFDGADDEMACPAIDISAKNKMTIIMSLRLMAGSAFQNTCNFGTSAGQGTYGCFNNAASPQFFAANAGSVAQAQMISNASETPNNVNRLHSLFYDLSAGTAATQVIIWYDRAVIPQSVNVAGPASGTWSAVSPIVIGSRGGTAFPANMRCWRAIFITRLLSGQELLDAQDWCAGPAGL